MEGLLHPYSFSLMASTPFSLLLLRRRFSCRNPFLFSGSLKPFSTASQPNPELSTSSDAKPSNLSARLSFVFDQIDAIERERSQKDETLQRIRAWRESKNQKKTTHEEESSRFGANEKESELKSGLEESESAAGAQLKGGLVKKEMELVHPWKEWIELMERLVQQNYFDHRRKDEDKMVQDLGFDMSEVVEEGFDFTRDWKTVQTACLNFGRDRFDILRSLSRQDIQILVGYGCPSVDKKVLFSAKLLRKHVHLDEGDVCSSCSLRSSCEKAYLLTNKEDEARTIDIMRVLMTYAFDPVNGSVVNKSLLKQKSVKTVVRKLLHQVCKLSAVPIDPNLPPPVFKKPPPKVKQPPPTPKKRVGRDDIEMKKGDWLCSKCDFMNFAKNTVCLQCDAKRPKRQLLPGEWECPECNFLNYRRNMACFHCECKRPQDAYMENQLQERQQGPRTRFEKVASRAEVSSAWNFDFDDNESDGADVAAFEHADTPRMDGDFPPDVRAQGGNIRGSEDDFNKTSRIPRTHEGEYSDPDNNRLGKGFDDFEDEEDDIDSYEIDNRKNPVRKDSLTEGYSESEDIEGSDSNRLPHRRADSLSYKKQANPMRQRAAFSGSEDDFDADEERPVHRNWKSSHVANTRQSRGGNGPSRAMNFVSEEDVGLGSDSDDDLDADFGSRKSGGDKWGSNIRGFRSRDTEDGTFYGSDSGDDDRRSMRSRSGGNKAGPRRGGNNFKGREREDFAGNSRYKSNSKMGDRRMDDRKNSFNDNFDRSSRGSRGDHRGGFKGGDYGGHKRNDRGDNFRSSNGPRREEYGNRERGHKRNDRGDNMRNFNGPRRGGGYGNQRHGKFDGNDNAYDGDRNFGDDRPRRVRIIER